MYHCNNGTKCSRLFAQALIARMRNIPTDDKPFVNCPLRSLTTFHISTYTLWVYICIYYMYICMYVCVMLRDVFDIQISIIGLKLCREYHFRIDLFVCRKSRVIVWVYNLNFDRKVSEFIYFICIYVFRIMFERLNLFYISNLNLSLP